ncbi:MAG: large conductance mechanosensitive channel protein MscL [Acidimicrobiia bacterium]|nr:large conductance mechanosensitive channel protein MscL [Acidimicrobiia bacterium]
MDEFKKFIMKGDLVTIAIAFIIGVEFSKVVTSFTDVIMGFVGAIVGKPSFNNLVLDIGDGQVPYGAFLTALINFLIVAFVLFLVIKGYDRMKDRMGVKEAEAGPTEADLLAEIRDELKQQRSA